MDASQVREIFPRGDPAWIEEVFRLAPTYGIDTANKMASFLAQFGYETTGFTRFEEDLDYSAHRLMAVWPKRFTDMHVAVMYAHNPERLAEKVYGGRMGNDQPGDGWLYRGRGPQLTGKDNYRKAGELVGFDLLALPDQVLEPEAGVLVACAGWKALGLNAYATDDDARKETEIINGGDNGLKERQALLGALLKVLQ